MEPNPSKEITDKWNMEIIRSARKTVALQADENAVITIRAPYSMSNADILRFLEENAGRIDRYIKRVQKRFGGGEAAWDKLSEEELQALADKALRYIPQRAEYFAEIIGVSYGKITVRNQKTRWGSCSSRGNLNFNCLLMLTPEDVIDYVVVHELCHRKEMNHSKAFWSEVERVIPDYKAKVRWLKDNGGAIIRRMLQ